MTLPLGDVVLHHYLVVVVQFPEMQFSVFSLLTRLDDMEVTLNDHVLVDLGDG